MAPWADERNEKEAAAKREKEADEKREKEAAAKRDVIHKSPVSGIFSWVCRRRCGRSKDVDKEKEKDEAPSPDTQRKCRRCGDYEPLLQVPAVAATTTEFCRRCKAVTDEMEAAAKDTLVVLAHIHI